MAILCMLFAGSFISLSNLFMRKSIDQGGTSRGFLVFQMGIAFVVSVLLNPVKTGLYAWNGSVLLLGALAGLVMAFMLICLGRSLEKGPAGLTFSILNGATVIPAIVMALLFGVSYGFPYTAWHAVGSFVLLCGLFMAGRGMAGLRDQKGWILFCAAMFSFHIFLLVLFQWRALLLRWPQPEEITSLFTIAEIQSQWFSPAMFLTAFCVQLIAFIRYENRKPSRSDASYGILGGVMNGLCTYFMIWSTELASPLEGAVIFPIFSVTTIALSNWWSQRLYQEKVNWMACQFCIAGLIVGTVDWGAVAAFIGW